MKIRIIGILSVAIIAGADPGVPVTRWTGLDVTLQGGASPDGRSISYVSPTSGALMVRDLITNKSRPVAIPPPGSGEFAYFSAFSRDGGRLAYAWFNGQGFYELRVSTVSKAETPAVIYSNEAAGFVQPCAWTPDDRFVLALLFRRDNISQIALIPAAGGPPRILRSLNWVYPKRMDISPDGQWIVYDNFAGTGKPERTIFILAADGSAEKRLVAQPGNFLFPMWAAGGRRVVFAGETDGRMLFWAVDVNAGEVLRSPYRISGELGRILPLGLAASGEVFYGVRTGGQDILIGNKPIRTRYAGRNSAPSWSADGKWLAYLSRRGTENFGEDTRIPVVQNLDTGDEREIACHMAHIERVSWSPDGRSLLAAGSDGKGRSGLFLVRIADGMVSPLAIEHGGPFRGWEAVWAPDGSSIYYLHGDGELRRHDLQDDSESTILRVPRMQHLAINPTGNVLAVGIAGNAIRLTPIGNGVPRLIPLPGINEIAWGQSLYVVSGAGLWKLPLDGADPERVTAPSGRVFGIAVSREGDRLACTYGKESAEVRSFVPSR